MRRAVRRVLANDSRFQEVHAGLWETIGWDYAELPLYETPFRVLDLEVTGSDPDHNAIIDMAVFEVVGDVIRPLLSTLVDPEMPIPPSIVRLTGIDDRMVRGQPRFENPAAGAGAHPGGWGVRGAQRVVRLPLPEDRTWNARPGDASPRRTSAP